MAAKPRGRGFLLKNTMSNELRRPGEINVSDKTNNSSQRNSKELEDLKPPGDDLGKLCLKIAEMELTLPKPALDTFAEELKGMCKTADQLEKCADKLFSFALQSKWNAHAVAVFCDAHGDITIDNVKLRNLFFKRLQGLYNERNKAYLNLDSFLMEATFACELFHHVRVGGKYLEVLASPILDYLGMLLCGASLKEVEVFVEQFPKCYQNLKDSEGFEDLQNKIRKQLTSEATTVTVKAMLLEIFELILTDFNDLSPSAKSLYATLSKPIVTICN